MREMRRFCLFIGAALLLNPTLCCFAAGNPQDQKTTQDNGRTQPKEKPPKKGETVSDTGLSTAKVEPESRSGERPAAKTSKRAKKATKEGATASTKSTS